MKEGKRWTGKRIEGRKRIGEKELEVGNNRIKQRRRRKERTNLEEHTERIRGKGG